MDWAVFIILVLAGASSGGFFKPGDWYDNLFKPRWTPPDWAFPVVWGLLYACIAWAGVLIWQAQGGALALTFWGAQWVFSTAWSWLFFGRRRMDLGFLDVTLLWLSVLGFIIIAWPLSKLAAVLFLPYLAWVSIAATLNVAVWRRNPNEQGVAIPGILRV